MGVLHSFFIKNIFYDKMDLRLFYFDVAMFFRIVTPLEIMPSSERRFDFISFVKQ